MDTSIVIGIDGQLGADEDDFHSFKRRKSEIEQSEKEGEKVKKMMDIKAGVVSGVVKSFGNPPAVSKSKVVYF